MTQANSENSTAMPGESPAQLSRRAVLTAIAVTATVPIAAALPANALPFEEDPAIALAARAVDAWNDFEAKCSVLSDCEDGVFEWVKLNPGPTMRSAFVGSDAEYLTFHAGRSTYDPNADLDAAAKEYGLGFSQKVGRAGDWIRTRRERARARQRPFWRYP
jgi:hypothetical protein